MSKPLATDTMMRTILPGEMYSHQLTYNRSVFAFRNEDRDKPFTVAWKDEWDEYHRKDYKTPHGAWARIQRLVPDNAQWWRSWPEDRKGDEGGTQ